MNRIKLDNIAVSEKLPLTVELAIKRAKRDKYRIKNVKRIFVIAAAAALCFAAFNFNAIAETARKIFFAAEMYPSIEEFLTPAIENGYYDSPSEKIDQVNGTENADSGLISGTVSESGGVAIELLNYYIDSTEIGFEFLLSGIDLDGYDNVDLLSNTIEIIHEDGTSLVWDSFYDENNQYTSRTFPGGFFYWDMKTGDNGYQDGNDIPTLDTRFLKTGDKQYSVIYMASFEEPVEIGEKLNFKISSIQLSKPEKSLKDEDWLAPDYLHGEWSFSTKISETFKQERECDYMVKNTEELAENGIEIIDLTMTPMRTTLRFKIDYLKAKITEETSPKMRAMDLNIELYCGGEKISFASLEHLDDGDIAECTARFNSVYFMEKDSLEFRIKRIDDALTMVYGENDTEFKLERLSTDYITIYIDLN